jgi:hypothetical protein
MQSSPFKYTIDVECGATADRRGGTQPDHRKHQITKNAVLLPSCISNRSDEAGIFQESNTGL